MNPDPSASSRLFVETPLGMTRKNMFKKLLLIIIVIAIAVAFLGGIFSVQLSPFSISIDKPEKDFLKKAANKAKNLIYREATEHNPPGDMLPDEIDDKIKQEIKEKVN